MDEVICDVKKTAVAWHRYCQGLLDASEVNAFFTVSEITVKVQGGLVGTGSALLSYAFSGHVCYYRKNLGGLVSTVDIGQTI